MMSFRCVKGVADSGLIVCGRHDIDGSRDSEKVPLGIETSTAGGTATTGKADGGDMSEGDCREPWFLYHFKNFLMD